MKDMERTRKCAILQSSYLPWKGYLDLMNSVDDFVFYDVVNFTKNDWRNRNKIKTAQGIQWLTIPVKMQGRLSQSIDQIRVADANWSEKHWKAISQNYSRCHYFEEYKAHFQHFYEANTSEMLSEINQKPGRPRKNAWKDADASTGVADDLSRRRSHRRRRACPTPFPNKALRRSSRSSPRPAPTST